MLGAVIGDVIGSVYEWDRIKTKEFELFRSDCEPTDDSVMTLAIAKAIIECRGNYVALGNAAIRYMREIGRLYPHCGFGGMFSEWIFSDAPSAPYGSFGNGAAMRVSACAWAAGSINEAKALSRAVTEVTHDHPEGIKGAEATTVAVFMALRGAGKNEIRKAIDDGYYALDFTLDGIRADYTFNETCQATVPQAITAFLESTSYEDAVRNAVGLGGDADTLAAITGSIAEAFYGIPVGIRERGISFLDERLKKIAIDFEKLYPPKIAV